MSLDVNDVVPPFRISKLPSDSQTSSSDNPPKSDTRWFPKYGFLSGRFGVIIFCIKPYGESGSRTFNLEWCKSPFSSFSSSGALLCENTSKFDFAHSIFLGTIFGVGVVWVSFCPKMLENF